MNTPVLFIIFNRLETTQRVFARIREARPAQLFVAADGPRADKAGEAEKCALVRDWVLNNIDWECETKTLFRDSNVGCGRGPSEAITWFFEQVEKGIILEDDCLPEITFFTFCEELLDRYADDEEVMLISGTNYFFNKIQSEYAYYFSNLVFIWGWASWRRAWNKFEYVPKEVERIEIAKRLNHEKYENLISNGIASIQFSYRDVWDLQWLSTIILNKGISITPIKNQVRNIGYVGTHTDGTQSHFFNMPSYPILNEELQKIPKKAINEKLDKIQMNTICKYEYLDNRLFARIIRRLKSGKLFH